MTKTEREGIRKWAEGLSDSQLERHYYESVFESLGSQTEEMYERGYDIADIREREKYEYDLGVITGILEGLCAKRGIKLWEDGDSDGNKEIL